MALPSSKGDREYNKFVEDASGNVAVRTTATISGDVNVDNNSVDTSGYIGKASGTNADFTTAYASGTTLTCSSLPSDISAIKADDIVSIVQVATSGAVTNTYTRDDVTITAAGTDPTTLTVTGATFVATDTFIVYTNIQRPITLKTGDIEIGAVEIKNATTDTRADVNAANTARTTATNVIAVQNIDAAGNVLDTASLALESGGNLATIAGDTTSLDGKIVVGGGTEAGAVRVTLANDSTGVLSVDDGGGSLTVDGTVTETNSAAILADTASMDTNLGTLAGAVSGSEMQVDVVTSALPTGAATEATLSTIDADTSALAGTVSGSELQVDVVGALPAGSNAIGKLAANSGVDIGDVDVTSQPARDNATDTITASLDTNAIMNDTTACTPKYAVINATVNGNNTIVAAVSGKKIRVLSYSIVADAAVGVAFEDGAGGSELSGQMAFAANGGISVPFSPVGHFETTANTLLNLETDAAANVRGHLCYIEV